MRTHRLGEDGPEVSVLGLGCNTFGLRIGFGETREIIATAIDLGVNFFDTADLYGKLDSERFLGKALGARRDEVVIATKWGWTTLDGAPERRSFGSTQARDAARLRALHPLGARAVVAASRHRLDRRLPVPQARR